MIQTSRFKKKKGKKTENDFQFIKQISPTPGPRRVYSFATIHTHTHFANLSVVAALWLDGQPSS